jgi:hypothetical protein
LASILTNSLIHNPKPGFDKSGDPILFYKAGTFPSGSDPEFDVLADARQVYKNGELSFLLRSMSQLSGTYGIPFWVAALVSEHGAQTVLLLIPFLSILVPLLRLLPTLYTWTVRRRLIYWYGELKLLEGNLEPGMRQQHVGELRSELDRIDGAVRRIKVPLAYSDQLYDLRGHIDLVRRRLVEGEPKLEAA